MTPRILTLDIETAPATALVFGQWKQDISNIQIIKRDRMIGVGAKWLDEPKPAWRSEYHHGREVMVRWTRDLIDDADIVVHFNGSTFDMPWIRREVAEQGLALPAPVREVDLLKVVKKQFRFTSNKLEAVLDFFGLDPKLGHSGFKMWRDIEVGDETAQRKAWTLMRRYCKQDVVSTEQLYVLFRERAYTPNHPHVGLYTGDDTILDGCSNCGSDELQRRGYATTSRGKYPRYQCQDCGKWNQDKKAVGFVETRGAA